MNVRHALVLILLLVTANAGAARADDRLVQIMMLWPSPDDHVLRVKINEALTVYREAGDPRREAIAYLFLSLADAAQGDVKNTRVHLGDAMSRLEASGDYVGTWLACWMFAEIERVVGGQSEHALAFYEKSFAMLERAKSPSAPFSIDALMVVGPIVGLPAADYEPNPTTAEVDRPRVLQLLEVFTRTGYGGTFVQLGDFGKAAVQLRRAKEVAALFEGRLDPPIDRHMGNLRQRQGRLDEAREIYIKTLESLEVLRPMGLIPPRRLTVEILGDLADLEMFSGRIDDALAWNVRALELARAAKSEEVEIAILRSRAEMLGRAGRFAAAEKVFAQALALAKSHEYFHLQVSIYLSSAAMNMPRGRHGAAAADIEKALEVLARAIEPLREPAIWANLAMYYILLGADDTGRMSLERARQLAEKNGNCLNRAAIELIESTRKFVNEEASFADFYRAIEQFSQTPDALSVPGMEELPQLMATLAGSTPADLQLHFRSGILSAGKAELLQAAKLFSEGQQLATARELAMKSIALNPNPKHRAGTLELIGASYVAEGDDEKGIAYLIRAMDALDTATRDAPGDPLLSGSRGGSSSVYETILPLLVKHRRYEEAFTVSERARARVFLQLLGNNRVSPRGLENTLPAQEAETLRMQMLQWRQQTHLAPTQQRDDDLRQARRRYEALMTRVKAANPEYAAMTGVEPLQLDVIREELTSNTTLLSYFITPDGVHAWVLDRTMLQYVPLPFGPAALASVECAAKRFRAAGRGIGLLGEPCAPATDEELYERLFAPLRKHVHNPRLIIVPHGTLHYLPFGAFRDPRTERYLIEDYTITYAPSASSIRFLRDKETPVNGKALVIGAPAGVLPELPGARHEAMMVANELQSVPMVGTAARESLLYQLNGDVDLVHIAAHGFYEPDTPLFSRLALAEGEGSDGFLEVHEILSEVDLTGVNLVVLSACQTALGKGSAGDEIVGLTRALLYAGTPGVISTLWDIGDHAAAALMSHFYCRLVSGDSAADALRYAQLQLLHGDYPDPSQWAAFTLNGDPEGRWNASGAVTTAEK